MARTQVTLQVEELLSALRRAAPCKPTGIGIGIGIGIIGVLSAAWGIIGELEQPHA